MSGEEERIVQRGHLRDFEVLRNLRATPAFPVYRVFSLSPNMPREVLEILQSEPTESNVDSMQALLAVEGNSLNANQMFRIIRSMQWFMISQRFLAIGMGMHERLGAISCLNALPSEILTMISKMQ
jgi:hypothetical protein